MTVTGSPRSRLACASLLIVTVLAGLASRRFPEYQPEFVARYAGDALWAAMVFWGFAILRPGSRARDLGLATLAVSVTVELSQLYRVPWLDAVRATRVGMLVLGQGFLWSDLVCYAAGTALALAIDRVAGAARTRRSQRERPHESGQRRKHMSG